MTTAESLEQLRAATLAGLEDLELERLAIAASTAAGPDDEHDPEGSTVGYERARVAALLERAHRSLAEIRLAEERLAEGRYGACSRCGEPIAGARLEVLPLTELCAPCALAGGGTAS